MLALRLQHGQTPHTGFTLQDQAELHGAASPGGERDGQGAGKV